MVSGDITINDTRPGVECYRKINLSEKASILSKPNYTASDLVPPSKHDGFFARSMDGAHMNSWMSDIENYLSRVSDEHDSYESPCLKISNSCDSLAMCPVSPIPAFMTNSQLHEGMGHMGEQKSAAMGIPFPKHCPVCELGNRKKSSGSKGVKDRNH